MALARFGAKRINDFDDASENSLEAVYCRLFYTQTAKALMRSHFWWFAKDRVQLSQDTTDPVFQWDYAYHLPNDFLRAILVYNGADNPTGETEYDYELEGKRLLTDEDEVYLKYVKWVPSEANWDALFIEVFTLVLAQKLVIPVSQDVKLKIDIGADLGPLMKKVRALDRQEEYHVGRVSRKTWNDARHSDYP